MEQTIGQKRVRCNFNPSKDNAIDEIKAKSAELIDFIYTLPPVDEDNFKEHLDLRDLACREIESACMWAVKLATLEFVK